MSLQNPYKKGSMFEGANHLIFERAKDLRMNMTVAETILWMHLKEGINGKRFRRQHPLGIYIVDFFCFKVKLIIEVDGSIHNEFETALMDEIRQKEIEDMGYKVIRFTNEEIMKEIEKVLRRITETVSELEYFQKQNASPISGV